ncbi:MAG: lipoyl(octanoyl) transferase LipB [Solirubrobacterales bacterium]|nr:lipoyl(octanoyl) transferase LipB [Solirubrobacterales bacterium]
MESELLVSRLGAVEYRAGVALQEDLRERVTSGELADVLLLLEHLPVYTRGRRSTPDELPLGEDWYRARGIDVLQTDRGGRVTYHGPGQLVGYPIMHIDDVLVYLRTMERAIIAALADEGVEAHARKGRDLTGVWVQDRKIASIGVHISRGVTTHGFAVNVDNDLEPFDWVVACGLPGVAMTSVRRETGRDSSFDSFRERMAERFCEAYERTGREISVDVASAARA